LGSRRHWPPTCNRSVIAGFAASGLLACFFMDLVTPSTPRGTPQSQTAPPLLREGWSFVSVTYDDLATHGSRRTTLLGGAPPQVLSTQIDMRRRVHCSSKVVLMSVSSSGLSAAPRL